jgi:hypothetical protein
MPATIHRLWQAVSFLGKCATENRGKYKNNVRHWKWLSSGMLRRGVWWKLTDVPEVLAASIIRVIAEESHVHNRLRENLKSQWQTKLQVGYNYLFYNHPMTILRACKLTLHKSKQGHNVFTPPALHRCGFRADRVGRLLECQRSLPPGCHFYKGHAVFVATQHLEEWRPPFGVQLLFAMFTDYREFSWAMKKCSCKKNSLCNLGFLG